MAPFDVAVVGAGMIGAAAGRHLAEAGHRVAIIGASEPEDRTTSPGPFASHHDAGRITRIVDTDPVWAQLAAASIERYDDLRRRSGISFHHPAGLAWVLETDRLASGMADGITRGAEVTSVTPEWLKQQTGIAVRAKDELSCAYEGPPAGHVHPVRLVAAELAVAEQSGATLVASSVDDLTWNAAGPVAGTATLSGTFGQVNARRVLLATGMYGAKLAGIDLALIRWPRATVRAEMRPAIALPSLIAYEVEQADIDHIYWVPPVEYPDGRVMLKIGGVYAPLPPGPLGSDEDVARWFQSGDTAGEAAALRGVISELLPDVDVLSWDAVPCVVTKTVTGRPYLGWVDDNIAVAVGGNGGAAKSGDEIGRIAASLFDENEGADKFNGLDRSLFEPVLKPT